MMPETQPFVCDDTSRIYLELTEEGLKQAWAESESSASARARWKNYIDRVCTNAILPWLQEEIDPDVAVVREAWGIVSGTKVSIGTAELAIVPSEVIDTREFRVSKEWIDLPSWIADYYLAVQVNLDDGWIELVGYTTHETLKNQGEYDETDRAYCSSEENLVEPILLAVARQVCPQEPTKARVQSLPECSLQEAEDLMQEIGCQSSVVTRLAIPFEKWGAFLENKHWRQQLSRLECNLLGESVTSLSRWLEGVVESGWQLLDNFDSLVGNRELAFRFRDSRSSSASRAKLLGSQLQGGDERVFLTVFITPIGANKNEVELLVLPTPDCLQLPETLEVAILDEDGQVCMQAKSQGRSNCRLKFNCSSGDRFDLQVSWNNFGMTESFVV